MRMLAVFLVVGAFATSASPQTHGISDIKQALAAYDAKVKVSGPDPAGLAPIAREVIRRDLEQEQGDPVFTASALERLANAGDTDALERLKRAARSASGTSDQELAPVLSLARLGDAEAQARLGSALANVDPTDRVRVIEQLEDADARSQAPKIVPLLADSNPQVRGRAALALGALHYRESIPALRKMFANDVAIVRLCAGAALKRLGDTTADAYLANVMKNSLAEVRLLAAEGYQDSRTAQWIEPMRELLTDPDPMTRIHAANLIACCAPDTARATLAQELKDSAPPIRSAAAAALESDRLIDAPLARRMIDDPLPAVRLHGASASLSLAKTKAPLKRVR